MNDLRRHILIYKDRETGKWVVLPDRTQSALSDVKKCGVSEAMKKCNSGMCTEVTPGETYYRGPGGLLKDLQWSAKSHLEADWYWNGTPR